MFEKENFFFHLDEGVICSSIGYFDLKHFLLLLFDSFIALVDLRNVHRKMHKKQ